MANLDDWERKAVVPGMAGHVMPLNRLPDSLTPFPVWFFRFDSVRRAEPAARVGSGWDRILACVGKTEYPTLCEGL